jgi:hypothetical protein
MPPKTQQERAAVFEEKLTSLESRVGKIETKVDEMHNVLMQAKGARWAIIGVAGLAGFLSAKMSSIFPHLFNSGGVIK